MGSMTTPTQTGDKPMVTPDAQDRKREALIVRLGAFADLLCQEPLPGASGDVAYDLLRQAAAQIASDRQHIARHREQETREQPLDTIQRLGQEFDGEQPRLGREAVRDAIHDAIVSAYRQGALDVHNEWIKLDLDDGLSDDPDFTEAAHDHAASEMPGLGAVIAALTFEPDVVFCERCQGNGELVTDWDRYMKGDMDASGEEYVEPCPDCEGEGHRTRPASPEASPSLGMGEAHGDRKCDACHRDNPVWFAPSPLWNLVIGGPEATDDPGGVLCPICFIEKEEAAGIMPATGAWLVTKEPAASLSPPSPDLAEENERLRPMEDAPKDGRYIIAAYRSLDGYAEQLHGRSFIIRHEGTTPSGYDLGWALFPGHGGVPDKCFYGWLPLPTTLQSISTGNP